MADSRDFAVDETGRLVLRAGGIHVQESLTQEVGLLLITCKGEMRFDPLCGCDLVRRMNGRISRAQLERTARVQMERDGKNWGDIKRGVNIKTNG